MPSNRLIAFAFVMNHLLSVAQPSYQFTITTTPEECNKATASLDIGGTVPSDSVAWDWSTGAHNMKLISQLSEGEYSIHTYIKRKQDSLVFIKDTTVYFNIGKIRCPIGVPKYFSPNDDGYNDLLRIANVDRYPDFEFHVYNKWGQRVHFQKKEFEPWNGTWNGFPLPDATYYFVFFYNGKDKESLVKGDIVILR